jgi:hypothetical protein
MAEEKVEAEALGAAGETTTVVEEAEVAALRNGTYDPITLLGLLEEEQGRK